MEERYGGPWGRGVGAMAREELHGKILGPLSILCFFISITEMVMHLLSGVIA